jgi:hypothetical protein
MFSLFVLYSPDRLAQLNISLECWKYIKLFKDCEKILIVDGQTNINPPGWNVCSLPRQQDHYCWADSINKGISLAKNDIVFYLDCDRIPPVYFFQSGVRVLQDNDCFVYPEELSNLKTECTSVEVIRRLSHNPDSFLLLPETRTTNPLNIGKKTPFSGCVGFNKSTYLRTGGVDPIYKGWGFPDTDILMSATLKGVTFETIPGMEIHQRHSYSVSPVELTLHNIWNMSLFISKWKLPRDLLYNKTTSWLHTDKRHAECIAILESSSSLTEFISKFNNEQDNTPDLR